MEVPYGVIIIGANICNDYLSMDRIALAFDAHSN